MAALTDRCEAPQRTGTVKFSNGHGLAPRARSLSASIPSLPPPQNRTRNWYVPRMAHALPAFAPPVVRAPARGACSLPLDCRWRVLHAGRNEMRAGRGGPPDGRQGLGGWVKASKRGGAGPGAGGRRPAARPTTTPAAAGEGGGEAPASVFGGAEVVNSVSPPGQSHWTS